MTPTVAKTIDTVTHVGQPFDWYSFFSNPITLVFLSALLTSGLVIGALKFIFKLGATTKSFNDAISDIGELKKGVQVIERCIVEMQTVMKAKYSRLHFTHTITIYGQSHSPVKLKSEYKEFITTAKIDEQIKNKNAQLLKWLRSQKPRTGLDAQDDIIDLVVSGQISQYLDLDNFRQNLYKKGKTSEDANGILFVYLFEILIPQLELLEEKTKNKS
jgi:hypothetical protein